tara:strand:- start:401 stop:1318 length:918 start_codon:yes stop_codon:yes gene_type:complete
MFKRAVIEVNGGCNYSCAMCPQSSPGRSKNFLKKLSLENFHTVLKQIGKVECIQLEGSGEPTLMSNLPDYISLARKYSDNVNIFTNGFRLKGDYMKRCVDAGLSLARFSVIGYDKITYIKMMNIDAFDLVKQNAIEMRNYGGSVASYHLIINQQKEEWEIEQYKNNFINPVQSQAMIWRQHNWSGSYDNPYKRKGIRKTCGRPFANEITVRAGGLNGKWGAVHPCCQVLGNDDDAVLGHVQDENVIDIFEGDLYNTLRKAHKNETFDDISYCKDCDFLVDDSEVLVFNTVSDFKLRQMLSTTVKL